MVICGKQTIDGDTAQVGPGIASRLKYAQLTLVDQIQSVDLKTKKVMWSGANWKAGTKLLKPRCR